MRSIRASVIIAAALVHLVASAGDSATGKKAGSPDAHSRGSFLSLLPDSALSLNVRAGLFDEVDDGLIPLAPLVRPAPEEEDIPPAEDPHEEGESEDRAAREPRPDLVQVPARTADEREVRSAAPLRERWWVWALITGATVAAGGAIYFSGNQNARTVLPEGSLGVADLRLWRLGE